MNTENEHWEGRLPACHLIVHIANIIFVIVGRLEACPPSAHSSVPPGVPPGVHSQCSSQCLFRLSAGCFVHQPRLCRQQGKAMEKTYSLKLSHVFYMSVIDKSEDATKMLDSYTNDFVVIKISKI